MELLGMALGVSTLSAQTVDVHTHIIIPEYLQVLKAHGAELEETFPLPGWDAERHIAFMDSTGIRAAVLTMPAPQPYYGNTEECAKCIRRVNEASEKIKRRYPGRFRFCAALPLPDVNAAIREAIYALDTLGADGVKLATNPTREVLRSLFTITSPDHILYGSDYPYLPDSVLNANRQRLKQTLASDKELAGYTDLFLWKNAEHLFIKNAAADNIPTE